MDNYINAKLFMKVLSIKNRPPNKFGDGFIDFVWFWKIIYLLPYLFSIEPKHRYRLMWLFLHFAF